MRAENGISAVSSAIGKVYRYSPPSNYSKIYYKCNIFVGSSGDPKLIGVFSFLIMPSPDRTHVRMRLICRFEITIVLDTIFEKNTNLIANELLRTN